MAERRITGPVSDPGRGARLRATQAALAAETNEDSYAPPDLIKHSPGVAKAWLNGDGSAFTNSADLAGVGTSYNLTSIVDNGAGDHTVNFNLDFSSADWTAAVNYSVITTDTADRDTSIVDKAAGSGRIDSEDGAGTNADMLIIDVVFFGVQV